MNMRATNDPYGGTAPLVDKMIGTAYGTVSLVARHLNEVRYVASNMASIDKVAAGLRNAAVAYGTTGLIGQTVTVELPEEVDQTKILASSVVIMASNGDVYDNSSGAFTTVIRNGMLRLTLTGNAPIQTQGVPFRWFVTHAGA